MFRTVPTSLRHCLSYVELTSTVLGALASTSTVNVFWVRETSVTTTLSLPAFACGTSPSHSAAPWFQPHSSQHAMRPRFCRG